MKYNIGPVLGSPPVLGPPSIEILETSSNHLDILAEPFAILYPHTVIF